MRPYLAALPLALLALPGASIAQGDPVSPGQARLATMLEGRTAGTPVNCLPLRGLDNSTVIDGTAIVYRRGSTLYVNQPRSGAESLDQDDILLTRSHSSQLCSIDTVELLDRGTQQWKGFVTLGSFVPYTRSE